MIIVNAPESILALQEANKRLRKESKELNMKSDSDMARFKKISIDIMVNTDAINRSIAALKNIQF